MTDSSDKRRDSREVPEQAPVESEIASAQWFRSLEANPHFRELLEMMGAIITEYDEDGRTVHISSSVTRTLGFDPEDQIGKLSEESVHPDDLERTTDLRHDRLPLSAQRTENHRTRHKSGHWVWFESSASRNFTAADGTTHGVAFSRDVTALKAAQEELRESEQRYRRVIEATDDAVIETAADGRVLFTTPNLGETVGYTPEEMEALEPFGNIHPDDLEQLKTTFEQAIKSESPSRLEPYRFRHRDGSWRWFQTAGMGYRHALSGERRFLNVTRDITDLMESAQRRIDQEARTQHEKRLESLGVMAGGMAHDFNNLLTPIFGDANLALSEVSENSPIRSRLERIQRTARRAAELTRHMLAYAGVEEIEPVLLDLSEFVSEATPVLEHTISGGAELVVELGRDLPQVLADASQLTQVLTNLLSNAVESMEPGGGTVKIRTGAVELPRDVIVMSPDGPVKAGSYAYLEVEDSGCGMDIDTQARIFDPFFTTKFTGRGLGLASVLGVLRAHRGSAAIESRPGSGTKMRVLLPSAEENSISNTDADAEFESLAREGSMILVIDDDEGTREVTAESLTRAGLRALIAADGEAGLELFRQHCDEIELVILDRTMPGLSGENTFDALREIRTGVPILLMSGYAEKRAAESFAGKGLSGFIGKPFLPDELVDKVRSVLAPPKR